MIAHLLSQVPYEEVEQPHLILPERPPSQGYVRTSRTSSTRSPTTPRRSVLTGRHSGSRHATAATGTTSGRAAAQVS